MGFDGGVTNNSQTLSIVTLNGGSTFTNTGDSNIGESGGSLATINLNDSSIYSGGNRTMVGWNGGTGVVTIANSATLVVNAWMSIGNQGGVGSVLVKDNGSLILPSGVSDLNICDVGAGQGSLTIMNNGSVSANNLFVGKGAGSVGTFTQSGGTTTGKNGGGTYIEVGSSASASGTVNLNAGILKARQIQSVNGTANSTFNFNGGLLVAAVDAAQGVNNNFMNNLTAANIMTGGANIDSGTNYITIAQALLSGPGGDGGLTKIGNGTLLLNGVNTYTNTTLVTAGTFGGNGTIAGPVIIQSGATLSPGAGGIGTLTINNNLTMAGNVAVDVNKTNLPASDLVTVSGTLSKTGTGTMNVSNLGPALQVGDAFTLFSQPVVNGNALTVVGGGVVWTNMLAINGSIQVVSLALPPTFSPGGVSHLANGNISLTATGTVGSSYTLWASTNLALRPITNTWTLLNSGTVTVSPFTIIDTTATNYAHQFYIFSTP